MSPALAPRGNRQGYRADSQVDVLPGYRRRSQQTSRVLFQLLSLLVCLVVNQQVLQRGCRQGCLLHLLHLDQAAFRLVLPLGFRLANRRARPHQNLLVSPRACRLLFLPVFLLRSHRVFLLGNRRRGHLLSRLNSRRLSQRKYLLHLHQGIHPVHRRHSLLLNRRNSRLVCSLDDRRHYQVLNRLNSRPVSHRVLLQAFPARCRLLSPLNSHPVCLLQFLLVAPVACHL